MAKHMLTAAITTTLASGLIIAANELAIKYALMT